MKNKLIILLGRYLLFVLLLSGINFIPGYGQGYYHNMGHNGLWPDSMSTITLNGKVIADSTHFSSMYYLDVNADDEADYILSFGPSWYHPENITHPVHGEEISIKGILWGSENYPRIVVLEINGSKWREQIEGGMFGWDMNHVWVDSLEVITVTGTVMLDSSYYYFHYFLDTNDDESPDYALNFGPPWFEPSNGTTRPVHGDIITIKGGIHSVGLGTTKLMVYEINGLKWRDPAEPSSWSGNWIHRSMGDASLIFCPSDSLSWMNYPGGSIMGGNMFPDSIYCQFEEIHHDYMPGDYDSTLFAGYYVNMFEPDGRGMMGQNGRRGRMNFNRSLHFQFHYDEIMLNLMNLSEHFITVRAWNEELSQWFDVANYVVDTESNLISFTNDNVYSYYAIFASINITGIEDNTQQEFSGNRKLIRNYPNPFSSETLIEFYLPTTEQVNLTIYDFRGRIIKTILNNELQPGLHAINWNTSNESYEIVSGYYFARLQTNTISQTLKLILIK